MEADRLIDDFGAVAPEDFDHVCGPDVAVNGARGYGARVTTICGLGVGLDVAQPLRRDGRYHVVETEGDHIDFAPLDAIEDAVLAHVRHRHARASTERVVSGAGIEPIFKTLTAIEGRVSAPRTDREIWTAAHEVGDCDACRWCGRAGWRPCGTGLKRLLLWLRCWR